MKIVWSRSIGWNMSFNGIEKLRPAMQHSMHITSRIHDGPDCYPWREVFAFWPVKTISGKRMWLKKVYKRKFWAIWGGGYHMEPEVEYAELLDILAEDPNEH